MKLLRLAVPSGPILLAQAARTAYRLEAHLRPVEVLEVFAEGSLDSDRQLQRLTEKLWEGTADAALCPASRLPLTLPAGVMVGAVLRDREERYRCVAAGTTSLDALPPHASVVTCDAVARAQIRHRFPRLRVDAAPPSWEIFAGLRHRAWDAAVLPPEGFDVGSVSGLLSEFLSVEDFVPAVGQGILTLLVLSEAGETRKLVQEATEPEVHARLRAERSFLQSISHPPGRVATARMAQEAWAVELTGLLAHPDGSWLVVKKEKASPDSAVEAATRLAAVCESEVGRSAGSRGREVLVH